MPLESPDPQHALGPAVRTASRGDLARWNAFVQAHGSSTFFHRFEWKQVLEDSFGHETHYLLAEFAGEITGILPLARVRSRLFGDALVSTPFCVYGGIVAQGAAAFGALTDAACRLATDLGVDHLEMRNLRRLHPDWPCKDLYVTFRKSIDPDSEKNMMAIPRKQRAMVRKGMQKGLKSRIDTDVADHYKMYSESLRNLGTPVFSRRYLEVLQASFGADVEILTVTHEGKPVSSVMNFMFKGEVLPYYGGGSAEARGLAASDYMYWEVMERARSRGANLFDYGRSKQGTGSFEFKCHWGFEPQPLFYEYFLVKARSVPNLSPTNPRYRAMIDMWKRLPLGLANRIGPPIAKYLG